MDGLVASVDRVVDGVVHRALDVRPLELVPGALPRDVAVGDAGVTLDGAETGVSWIQILFFEKFQQTRNYKMLPRLMRIVAVARIHPRLVSMMTLGS